MASTQAGSELLSAAAGIQLAPKHEDHFPENGGEGVIHFDFKKPLQDGIKSVFDHGGKVTSS